MQLLFLGTGTSTGVPQIGCQCQTCRSLDPKDKRLRASAILTVGDKSILFDAGPDLRTQLLAAGSPKLDALLITHSHFDHVGGIIDLRSYCCKESFPVYCQQDVAGDLHKFFPYCFGDHLYPGVPTFDIHSVEANRPFNIGGLEVMPLRVMHYKLPILGYRIGDFAYVTDCLTMPDDTLERLKGVDTLVINALRIEPHMSHMSLDEALQVIEAVRPRQAFLTHMSHGIGLHESVKLPSGVALAYDMLQVEF